MIGIAAAVLSAVVVGVVALAALTDWGGRVGPVGRFGRLGFTCMAGGLLWAAPGRFSGSAAGPADLMFLLGLVMALLSLFGRGIWRRADALDGAEDGKISLSRSVWPRGAAGRQEGPTPGPRPTRRQG